MKLIFVFLVTPVGFLAGVSRVVINIGVYSDYRASGSRPKHYRDDSEVENVHEKPPLHRLSFESVSRLNEAEL